MLSDFFDRQRCMDYFECVVRKYYDIFTRYKGSFNYISNAIEGKIFRYEYSQGGQSMPRGFYSPSYADLFVGGCNRGRLLKGMPKKFNYEYSFDESDKLIRVKSFDNYDMDEMKWFNTEFLIYSDDRVTAFDYDMYGDPNSNLCRISECVYKNNVLAKYESAQFTIKKLLEIYTEVPGYDNNGRFASLIRHTYRTCFKSLTTEEYRFQRDAKGHLSTYTCKCWNDFGYMEDSKVYKVLHKNNR